MPYTEPQILPEDQMSLKDILVKLIKFKNLIVNNWKIIVIFTVLGIIGGIIVEFISKEDPTYAAKITFNMENGGGNTAGGLADLASQFGFGGGASSGNTGLFSGENFKELLKTKGIYRKALLSEVNIGGKKVIFANYFLKKSGVLKDEWEDDVEAKTFQFKHNNPKLLNVKELDYLNRISEFLKPLTVLGADNSKSSFTTLTVTTRNDTLSYTWANLFLKTVTSFYIETKTKKTRELLELIDSRVDSLRNALYRNQGALARYNDQNQQIIMQQGRLQSERLSMNTSQTQSLYYEAVKSQDNLRFSVVKEAPLFTRIDDAELPIPGTPVNFGKFIKIGAAIGLVLSLIYITVRKALRDILNS